MELLSATEDRYGGVEADIQKEIRRPSEGMSEFK